MSAISLSLVSVHDPNQFRLGDHLKVVVSVGISTHKFPACADEEFSAVLNDLTTS